MNHCLEFGVAEGNTLRQLRECVSYPRAVFGFDWFCGLPEDWESNQQPRGAFSTQGEAPYVRNTIIYKGLFSETIPQYLEDYPLYQAIGLIHIDSDLYSSCREILFGLNDRIWRGTLLVFDEWTFGDEHRAAEEWQTELHREIQHIPFEDETSAGQDRYIARVVR